MMNHGNEEPIELYYLKVDVGEQRDLAGVHPDIVAKAETIFRESHVPSGHFIWKYLMTEKGDSPQ